MASDVILGSGGGAPQDVDAATLLGALARLRLGPADAAPLRFAKATADSRAVGAGDLFAALKGVAAHGASYAGGAIRQGAAAVLTDLEGALRIRETLGDWPVPIFVCDDPRRVFALTAAALEPAQPEILVAVTGTNGKTSTADFAAQLFALCAQPSASFGTIGLKTYGLGEGDVNEPIGMTTLEPAAFHALLARLQALGVAAAALEASSHGLAQRRLAGARLAAGALTSFARDHLDYHADAFDYAAAKLRLFSTLLPGGAAAVLNADDPLFGPAEAVARARGLDVIAYGRAADADGLRLLAQEPNAAGQRIRVGWRGAAMTADLQLIGSFQAHNALAAAGLAIGAGLPADAVLSALQWLDGVPGRMQLVARRANGAGVFVDYAHTPDALIAALAALRPHTDNRLHVVFGAGGDRDAGKRPLMGEAAARGADRVVVTDDNPRSEDPATIRAAVMQGCPDAIEVGDRAEAILRGVDGLEAGDALLIAGKGHETGQTIGGETRPFDDAEQARAAVMALDGDAGEIIGA